MPTETIFPSLGGWETTRQTLHLYTKAVGIIPRAHAQPDPRWWHISLGVRPEGLVTHSMALPSGGEFWLRIDFREHRVFLEIDQQTVRGFSMLEGLPASIFGNRILEAIKGMGLAGKYERDRFENHYWNMQRRFSRSANPLC